MANMCSNSVVFTGEPGAIENVKALFREIEREQEVSGKYFLPAFVETGSGYMQDIVVNEQAISFETRWAPNLRCLTQIADHFNLDFVANYEERSSDIFGESRYGKGTLLEINLEQNDQTHESEISDLEQLLEEKKAQIFKTTSNITKEELDHLYGDMTQADLVLKFAEHKNFEAAKEAFQRIDNDTLNEIDEYLNKTSLYGREQFTTEDKYIAMSYLKILINEWNDRRPPSFGLQR